MSLSKCVEKGGGGPPNQRRPPTLLTRKRRPTVYGEERRERERRSRGRRGRRAVAKDAGGERTERRQVLLPGPCCYPVTVHRAEFATRVFERLRWIMHVYSRGTRPRGAAKFSKPRVEGGLIKGGMRGGERRVGAGKLLRILRRTKRASLDRDTSLARYPESLSWHEIRYQWREGRSNWTLVFDEEK